MLTWIVLVKFLAYLFFGLLNGGVTAANIVLHNSKACSNQEEIIRKGFISYIVDFWKYVIFENFKSIL